MSPYFSYFKENVWIIVDESFCERKNCTVQAKLLQCEWANIEHVKIYKGNNPKKEINKQIQIIYVPYHFLFGFEYKSYHETT